jgi:hypothetical protein
MKEFEEKYAEIMEGIAGDKTSNVHIHLEGKGKPFEKLAAIRLYFTEEAYSSVLFEFTSEELILQVKGILANVVQTVPNFKKMEIVSLANGGDIVSL